MTDNILPFKKRDDPELPSMADTLRMIADAIDAGEVGPRQAFVLFSEALDGSGEADVGIRGFANDKDAARYMRTWFRNMGFAP